MRALKAGMAVVGVSLVLAGCGGGSGKANETQRLREEVADLRRQVATTTTVSGPTTATTLAPTTTSSIAAPTTTVPRPTSTTRRTVVTASSTTTTRGQITIGTQRVTVAGGTGQTAVGSPSHSLAATVLVDSYVAKNIGTPCGGTGRFAGFQTGQKVEISDAAGTVLATGALGACHWTQTQGCFNCPGVPTYEQAKPLFDVNVAGVPETSAYVIRIDWKLWSPITLADMRSSGWLVHLGVK